MIRCCICRYPAVAIVYDRGWKKPHCHTCWPKIDIPKDARNHPITGELVTLGK